tara:strand:+ start:85 stop:288 length:204 start_codon:yes stop_codon:yes gene_type:complete
MLFKEAIVRLSKAEAMDMWMKKLELVDRAIDESKTGWSLNYWNSVRRQLVQQLNLIGANVIEGKTEN